MSILETIIIGVFGIASAGFILLLALPWAYRYLMKFDDPFKRTIVVANVVLLLVVFGWVLYDENSFIELTGVSSGKVVGAILIVVFPIIFSSFHWLLKWILIGEKSYNK